jgi:putative transposase
MKTTDAYKSLPAKVSSSVLLMVQKNFKSFFKAKAEFYKNPSKFKGKPNLPGYLNKEKGRFVVPYTNQAISNKIFRVSNKIKLSKTNIEFNTKITDFNIINCIRIIPRLDSYVIEVVYTIPDTEQLPDNKRYLSIDLGVGNLATLTSNIKEFNPIVINGKPLKSYNQFYNKKLSYYKSILDKRNKSKSSKCTRRLTNKRTNKIDNYLHRASKQIVSLAKEHNLNTIVIGKNENWKQDVNLTKPNNQNFVGISHSRFIDMIVYKCEIEGIKVILQEESYTSKASFLNMDEIPVYGKVKDDELSFSGYRKSRGIYKIKGEKNLINADVNGSYNILRKAFSKAFANGIEGVGIHPQVINLK